MTLSKGLNRRVISNFLLFVARHGQRLAPFLSATGEHSRATDSFEACAKAGLADSLGFAGLVGTFHFYSRKKFKFQYDKRGRFSSAFLKNVNASTVQKNNVYSQALTFKVSFFLFSLYRTLTHL